jgi:hypothetical protein
MVCVIGEKMEDVLKMDYVKPMDFRGKTLKEPTFVSE